MDECKCFESRGVRVQENGIIRNTDGHIICRLGEVPELIKETDQLKAHIAQLVGALLEVEKVGVFIAKHSELDEARWSVNRALSTPISRQFIKEQRARDTVIKWMRCQRVTREEVEDTGDDKSLYRYDELHKALDNLEEIEKGEGHES